MANKRMFSIDVTETDSFLEMPLTAQALYFHLGMRGDDDGFVSNPRSIMRVAGCSEGDLAILAEAGYIISFRSGVIVISDWKVNNNLRNDRYKPTTFQSERSMLSETANKRYILNSTPTGSQMDTIGIPSDNQVTPQPNVTQRNPTQRNPTQRSSNSNDTAAAADPRTDPGLAEIVQHFQDVIGIFPRSALNKLQRWREVYPAEIIHAAVDEAAENNVRKWRYVDGVLKGWQADGVRTLGDVEARREARKKPEQPQEKKWEMLA